MENVHEQDTMMTRFTIRRDLAWTPFLLLLGAIESNSFVELDGDQLNLRFGGYSAMVPISVVDSIQSTNWAIWRGIGIRVSLNQRIGLIGSTAGVVQINLSTPCVPFLGVKANTLFVSLDDPEGFIKMLEAKIVN